MYSADRCGALKRRALSYPALSFRIDTAQTTRSLVSTHPLSTDNVSVAVRQRIRTRPSTVSFTSGNGNVEGSPRSITPRRQRNYPPGANPLPPGGNWVTPTPQLPTTDTCMLTDCVKIPNKNALQPRGGRRSQEGTGRVYPMLSVSLPGVTAISLIFPVTPNPRWDAIAVTRM